MAKSTTDYQLPTIPKMPTRRKREIDSDSSRKKLKNLEKEKISTMHSTRIL